MKAIILGCGRVGSILAGQLAGMGHDVTIIDVNADAFRRLGDTGVKRIVGSGIDEGVLRKAGIEEADAFVAVTNGDNTNIMSVQIAETRFNVKHAIARIYDPIRAQAYREMGINTVCTSLLSAGVFRDYLLDRPWGNASDYFRLESGQGESAAEEE